MRWKKSCQCKKECQKNKGGLSSGHALRASHIQFGAAWAPLNSDSTCDRSSDCVVIKCKKKKHNEQPHIAHVQKHNAQHTLRLRKTQTTHIWTRAKNCWDTWRRLRLLPPRVVCMVEPPTASSLSGSRVYRGCPAGTHPCDLVSRTSSVCWSWWLWLSWWGEGSVQLLENTNTPLRPGRLRVQVDPSEPRTFRGSSAQSSLHVRRSPTCSRHFSVFIMQNWFSISCDRCPEKKNKLPSVAQFIHQLWRRLWKMRCPGGRIGPSVSDPNSWGLIRSSRASWWATHGSCGATWRSRSNQATSFSFWRRWLKEVSKQCESDMSNNGRPHAVRLTNTSWKLVLNVSITTDQRPLRRAVRNIGYLRRPRARLQRAHNDLSMTTQVCSWEHGFCSASRAQNAARIIDLLDGVDLGNVCGRAELCGRLPQAAEKEQLRAHASCTLFIASFAHSFGDACRKWCWCFNGPTAKSDCYFLCGLDKARAVSLRLSCRPGSRAHQTSLEAQLADLRVGESLSIPQPRSLSRRLTSLLVRYALKATSPAFVFLDVLGRWPESIIPVAVVRWVAFVRNKPTVARWVSQIWATFWE